MPFRPVQKEPCGQCPFRRKSLPGWLGADTPEGFVANIQGEYPMPCHTTIDYRHSDWKEQWERAAIGKMCAGALIFASNLCKRARNEKAIPHVDPDHESIFATRQEFIDHHRSVEHGSWEGFAAQEQHLTRLFSLGTFGDVVVEVTRCHLCSSKVGKEHLCYGCKAYICERCDENLGLPPGPHAPEEHRE